MHLTGNGNDPSLQVCIVTGARQAGVGMGMESFSRTDFEWLTSTLQ